MDKRDPRERPASGARGGRTGGERQGRERDDRGGRDQRQDRGRAGDRRAGNQARGDRPGRSSQGRDERSGRSSQGRGERSGRSSGEGRGEQAANQPVSAGSTADRGPSGPPVAEDVTPRDLDPVARGELRSLPKDLADIVARHLVMAGRLLDSDPETAYRHTQEARRRASRVGVVREACGLAAYQTQRWSNALTELRAARRLTGNDDYLPIIADCERGAGRPQRALATARSAEAQALEPASRVEMRIVESGARRDLGEYDAAVLALRGRELVTRTHHPYTSRLYYAYAEALLDAGRADEAAEWFTRAARADTAGETDAADRATDLEGLELVDVAEDG